MLSMSIPTDPVLSGPPLPLTPYLFRTLQGFKPVIHPAPFPKDSGYLNPFWWTTLSKCSKTRANTTFSVSKLIQELPHRVLQQRQKWWWFDLWACPLEPVHSTLLTLPPHDWRKCNTDSVRWNVHQHSVWINSYTFSLVWGLDKGMEWDEGKHGVRKPSRI